MIEDKIEQMAIRHPLLIELIILVLLPIGLFFTYIWVFFEFLSSFFKRKSDIYEPQTIVITGASSGIGAALALEYAQPGKRLGLLARNESTLINCFTRDIYIFSSTKSGCQSVSIEGCRSGLYASRHEGYIEIGNKIKRL